MSSVALRASERPSLNLEELVLSVGAHGSQAEGVCVMEAASIVAGEPWSDRPACASPVIGRFLRRWNDTLTWKPRQSLKRFICPVIGTRTTDADEALRARLVQDWVVRTYAPAWLRLAGLGQHADALSTLVPLTITTIADVRPALIAARDAAVFRALPSKGTTMPLVRRFARETAWDAASATLVAERWGEDPPPPASDPQLILDVALTALVAATCEQLGPTARLLRGSACDLVEDMCMVGQPARQRWSA
jgi:hypothetical protein